MQTLKLTKKHDTYPKYKDSGVDWLDVIPIGWKINKLKRLFDFQSGDGFPDNLQGGKTGNIPFMKVSDINGADRYVENANNYVDIKTVREKSWHLIPENSILMSKIGAALGKNHRKINTIPVCIDNNMLAVTPSKVLPEYGYWIWKAINMSDFENISSVPSVNVDLLRNYQFTFPSINEQSKIANFLDKKTTLIDQIIKKKQKLIELLKEKRIAVINEAVTKGLDKDVELVDSGVEWIGKIPKNFQTIALGKLLDYVQPTEYIASEIFKNKENNSIPVLTAGKGFILGYTNEEDGVFKKDLPVVIFDDFTTSKQFVDFPFKVRSSALKILKNRSNKKTDIRFIYRCMEVLDFQTLEHNRHWISMYRYEQIPITCKGEQITIADYLDEKDKIFNHTIKKIEQSICLLKEFKSSLISNIVTGKVKIN